MNIMDNVEALQDRADFIFSLRRLADELDEDQTLPLPLPRLRSKDLGREDKLLSYDEVDEIMVLVLEYGHLTRAWKQAEHTYIIDRLRPRDYAPVQAAIDATLEAQNKIQTHLYDIPSAS